MNLFIPAIEWNEKIIFGDITTGSAVISNISDTSSIEVNQVMVSNAFPYNTRVISKTADSITLDQNATATVTNKHFSIYERFDFTYPPSTDDEEQSSVEKQIAESESGLRQTVFNYIELKRTLVFWFITKAQRDTLRDEIYYKFLAQGKKIKYFEDKEINSFVEYEDDAAKFDQNRQVKKHPEFLYRINFDFRRVLDLDIGGDDASIESSIIIGS